MTATIRFGMPGPADSEQVVLGTRWGDGSTPNPNTWRETFPYAMGVTSTALNATFRVIGGSGTESVDADGASGIPKTLFHPDVGLIPNGITEICLFNGNSVATDQIRSLVPGRIRVIAGIESALDGTDWFGRESVPNDNYATLDGLLTPALEPYQDNPDVIAYILGDDLDATNEPMKTLIEQAMDRTQFLDAYHRPASPSLLGGDPSVGDPKVRVIFSGRYASRWLSEGVKRAEGDFTIPDANLDWQRVLRLEILATPEVHSWVWMGAHQLGDGSGGFPDLSYPTKREIRKMVWEGIGSGAKGFIWFIYQDLADTWDGLANPTSSDRMSGVAEMGQRLTPNIRRRLLTSDPTANNDEFTASGGGSADWVGVDYANAYISTLRDSTNNVYYVVVCNRSTSTSSVTIDSATLNGTLVSLETGESINVGGSISLPALDGTIFRFVESAGLYGVPHYVPDGEWTTEEAWAEHWTNPASANYVASGGILNWPNQVSVGASDDLQALVDAAPDETTFVLAANGEYDGLRLTERAHLHFVAADPNNKPIIHGVLMLGHEELTDPLGLYPRSNGPGPNVGGYTNWVNKVVTTRDAGCIATYLDPPRDILFQDIRFEPIAGAITEHNYHDPNTWLVSEVAGMVSADWPGRNIPVGAAAMADVCFDRCEFRDWVYTNTSGTDDSGPMPFNHSGIFHNTGGIHNFVVRNCTLECGTYQDGQGAWHSIFYMDGGMGCAFVYNDISGAWKGLHALFLTNDDLAATDDLHQDGIAGWDKVNETPSGRYNFVVGNNKFITTMRGFNCLVAENTMSLAATWSASSSQAVHIEGQCWKGGSPPSTPQLEYHFLDNVVRDNTITGLTISSSATFVRHATPSTSCGNRVGQTTISGNTVSGTVVAWYVNGSVDNDPSTATNNTANGVTRDGV